MDAETPVKQNILFNKYLIYWSVHFPDVIVTLVTSCLWTRRHVRLQKITTKWKGRFFNQKVKIFSLILCNYQNLPFLRHTSLWLTYLYLHLSFSKNSWSPASSDNDDDDAGIIVKLALIVYKAKSGEPISIPVSLIWNYTFL